MGFSRQTYCSGLPFSSPEDFPKPRIEPESLKSPALAGGFFTTSATWEAPWASSTLTKEALGNPSGYECVTGLDFLQEGSCGTETLLGAKRLTVSIAVAKKTMPAWCWVVCWGAGVGSKQEQGPRAGHSLVTLASVLFLSSKWMIRKPNHSNLDRDHSVCGFQKLLLTLSWQELQLRGHSGWSSGLCVLRKLQTRGLRAERRVWWGCSLSPGVCVWAGLVLLCHYLFKAESFWLWLWKRQCSLNNNQAKWLYSNNSDIGGPSELYWGYMTNACMVSHRFAMSFVFLGLVLCFPVFRNNEYLPPPPSAFDFYFSTFQKHTLDDFFYSQ